MEARTLLSFVYHGFGELTSLNDPRELGDGTTDRYFGPIAVLDDIDRDGVRDLLIGNAGTETTGRTVSYLRGAIVVSGRSGQLMRTHDEPGNFYDGYGWQVANVGDVDADGVADYGISYGGYLYSGATGTLIRQYGGPIVAAGDVNLDGTADLLVGDPVNQRAYVYSGVTDTILQTYTPTPVANGVEFGGLLNGGFDLDADGVPDAVVGSRVNLGNGQQSSRLWAFSGETGELLWDRDNPSGINFFSAYGPLANLFQDLTGDGTPDLVVTDADRLLILSGVDGAEVRAFMPIPGANLGKFVQIYGDLDQDAAADLVLSIGTHVVVISSATGEVLSQVSFLGEPPYLGPYGYGGAFGSAVAVTDLDSDSVNDIVGFYQRFGSYFQPGFSRAVVFNGTALQGTTVTGSGSGPVSRSILWGQASSRAFIARDGVIEFLHGRAQWNARDVVLDVHESADEIVILGAINARGESPFMWIADHTFENVRRIEIIGVAPIQRGDAPPPPTLDYYGVAVAGHTALLHRIIGGVVSDVVMYDADTGEIEYLSEGVPVDLAINETGVLTTLFYSAGQDPPSTFVARNGMISNLPGRPVRLSPSGRWAVSVSVPPGVPNTLFLQSLPFVGDFTFQEVPGLGIGSDFAPVGINDAGDISGSFIVTETGHRSAFYYAAGAQTMFDVRGSDVFGDPTDFVTTPITKVLGPSNASDLMILQGNRYALVSLANITQADNTDGPARAGGGDAAVSVAVTPSGQVYVIMTNAAGEVLELVRGADDRWIFNDLGNDIGSRSIQSSQVITWYQPGSSRPTIAIARPDGLFLLESSNGGGYTTRNLTQEIAGAEPIFDAFLTFVPQNNLRILAGLNADGELMLYGQTVFSNPNGSQAWAFDNLYDTLVYPTNTPPPRFREYIQKPSLVGYVTSWGGQNIAGIAGGGQVVVFWTAPGLTGWRITNLTQVLQNPNDPGGGGFTSITVALTPWSGINIYGEAYNDNRIRVLWWVPQFGGQWRADQLAATNYTPVGNYPAGTISSYSSSWGGLNIARVDPNGQIEVYWWSPASNHWTREVLNPQTTSHLRNFRAVGRLTTTVTPTGEFNIFARNELGDLFRFHWDPQNPWRLERL